MTDLGAGGDIGVVDVGVDVVVFVVVLVVVIVVGVIVGVVGFFFFDDDGFVIFL